MTTLLLRPDDPSAAEPDGPGSPPGLRRADRGPVRTPLLSRARHAVVCLGFLALTLAQQPGTLLGDTKLDLVVDPVGFLGRALRMWEPQGFAGHVQDQAYGYLFPMGPFFALGQLCGLPMWVVQRLWMAGILAVAYLGAVALARRLRIGTPEARLIAGLAYALAPRMVTGLGATSIEVLPMAVAPWVLVPLVTAAYRGSPRRAAALSGLAVLCAGGVNAVAAAAVLPLPVLWLLTRPGGRRRRRLAAWWSVAVVLACAWWVGPLLLLGRYGTNFLDYIETAGTTTGVTDLFSALRGTTQWLAYLATPAGPSWPAGWALVHGSVAVVATVVLAGAGLLGLARRDLRERAWLLIGVLTGLVLVTAGHLEPVQGFFAHPLHAALDGVLAPLRNLHKFDPVLRLPLALATAHLLGRLLRRTRRPTTGGAWARAGAAAVALAVAVPAFPAVAGHLAPPTGFGDIPTYWRTTARWLADATPSGRALLVPASSFGVYAWGSPRDEPLQAIADSPWEVRDAVPWTSAAHIRMLDAVEDRLARGQGSAGLARYLGEAGIGYLVVRDDLDYGAAESARPALVQRALADSPGLRRVASFGPLVPGATTLGDTVLDGGLTPQLPAIEVFAVADAAPRAYTTPLSEVATVAGGPDGLLAAEDRGLVTDRPALLTGDGGPAGSATVVSDAQLRRERTFGRIDDAASAGLAADDPLRLDGPARDYLSPGSAAGESVVRYDGGRVSASSSASDADSFGGTIPSDQPWAALDGQLGTAWRPANRLGAAQSVWWRVDADSPLPARTIGITLAGGADDPPVRVRVTTDAGSRTVLLRAGGAVQQVALPPGSTRSLTLAADVGGSAGTTLALAEVTVPGLRISRTVVPPAVDGPVAAYTFDAEDPAVPGCVTDGGGPTVCSPALVRDGAEAAGIDRTFDVPVAAAYDLSATVTPRPGPALDALIQQTARPWGPAVRASSSSVPDPRGGADAAVDGDPLTTWVAAAGDPHPTLTVDWPVARTVDSISVGLGAGAAATRPVGVTVTANGVEQSVTLDENGTAALAPVTTKRVVVSFPDTLTMTTFDPYTRARTVLGVGVSELRLGSIAGASADAPVDVPCGQGPAVEVDGVARATSVHTTLGALRSLQPVPLTLCDGEASTGRLGPGEHSLAVAGTDLFGATSATLLRSAADGGTSAAGTGGRGAVQISRWDAEHRTVRVAARTEDTLLVVPENTNAGWRATLAGQALRAVTVDGWQQGYVVPAGSAGTVHLDYTPGGTYRAALLGGAAAVLLLLALALLGTRRPVPPPMGRGRGARLLVVPAAVCATALIGGVVGLVILTGAALAARLARSRRAAVLAAAAVAALVAATLVHLFAPGPAAGTADQVLVLGALGAAVVAALGSGDGARRSGTRPRHRRTGRSTRR